MLDIFHQTYNARHSEPQDVAKSFIWSTHFKKLIQNNHSVILGARGCGKTTLMKMLTIPALYNWEDNERAEIVRKTIPFYAVYISTDIYWDVKNQTYNKQLKEFSGLPERISQFAVNSNVFKALCNTFISIIRLELRNKNDELEVELCKHLIKSWYLDKTVPKLEYIKEAIDERIDTVNQLIQEIIFNRLPSEKIDLPNYFNLTFESSLEQIIPKFERIYNISNKNKKWALCFDELEFAPIWLQKSLFNSLRSRNQFILYKLSASPILTSDVAVSIMKDYSPTSGNDVQLIKMWGANDSERFSKEIIKAYLKSEVDLNKIFGVNDIYNKNSDSYTKESIFYSHLTNLIKKDFSFKNFLKSKGVDVSNPEMDDLKQKDELFRKIKPIVYHRDFFIEYNDFNKGINYRSRKKSINLYSGIDVLSKICDGNPRWLISIINELKGKIRDGKITKGAQFDELLKASKRFKNAMANIPVENSNMTLVDIIERLGGSFKDQILGKNFKMDPKGTFEVDEQNLEVNESIVKLIYNGISQGAFILLDYDDDSFDFEVRGRRFKLAYLFYILYNLPLRNYPALKLSIGLRGANHIDNSNQGVLFNNE